jgi:hypothetical protein
VLPKAACGGCKQSHWRPARQRHSLGDRSNGICCCTLLLLLLLLLLLPRTCTDASRRCQQHSHA